MLVGCAIPPVSSTEMTQLPREATSSNPQIIVTVTPVKPPAEVSFTWVGDMTFGTKGNGPKAGPGSLFDGIRKYLASDVTMGNLETVIGTVTPDKCPKDAKPGTCYMFVAPPETAQALKDAGFTVVNTANNHSLDAGMAGVKSTQAALKAAGVLWTGRPGQITYVKAQGLEVAVLGYAPYSNVSNALNISEMKELVKKAGKKADLVVVIMHLGAEGGDKQHVKPGTERAFNENRGDPIAFSHAAIDAGADLVVGSGPHVLRGMQWYKGRLIAYSLANFTGYGTLGCGGILSNSGILRVTLGEKGDFVDGNLTPVLLKSPCTPTFDSTGQSITMMNSLSKADFKGQGAVTMDKTGKIAPPA